MAPSPSRRRQPPRVRPRGEHREDEGPGGARRSFAPNAFRGVLVVGTVLLVGVLTVAVATDTTDELPWGAIIGVAAIMVFAFVAGRRRARALDRYDEG